MAVIAAITAAFGMAGSLSQATTAKRAQERASEEAALAVAQARDAISKMPVLESNGANSKRFIKTKKAIT
jgi:hypothetical protein